MSLTKANAYIDSFYDVIGKTPEKFCKENLKVGIDLGTCNVCIAVLDKNNVPITGEIFPCSVVKDGLVYDYIKAVEIVKMLKDKIEKRLNITIERCACAVPPGTVGKNASAVSNVIEANGIDVINVVDEPFAASCVLKIKNGAVVDVGGGTTGISIVKDGKVISSYDEATGGTHMTLVLSGNYNISIPEAEKLKLDKKNHSEIFHVIRPVAEKMATITKNYIKDYNVKKIYVVGGASSFSGFEEVFKKECKVETIKPNHPLLITPLGIALCCYENEVSL